MIARARAGSRTRQRDTLSRRQRAALARRTQVIMRGGEAGEPFCAGLVLEEELRAVFGGVGHVKLELHGFERPGSGDDPRQHRNRHGIALDQ